MSILYLILYPLVWTLFLKTMASFKFRIPVENMSAALRRSLEEGQFLNEKIQKTTHPSLI